LDDRRFDSLVRSLASGANRRTVLKGLLGLGGAAVAGPFVSDTQAARRPTPTPKPVTCPGQQTPVDGQCECVPPKASGSQKCGPSCCNPEGLGAAYTECCDQSCCAGHCYGEELCCPYPRAFCDITGECCPEGWTCCPDYGCIAPGQCCTTADCTEDICATVVCNADHQCLYTEDCTLGGAEECCIDDEVCLDNGECCTPSCAPGTCGGDGCSGDCFCPEGQVCSGGGCFVPCQSNPQNACPHCSIWQCLPTNGGTAQICVAPSAIACGEGVVCPEGTYCAAGLCTVPCS
jgi:hypothetical protein